MQYETILLELMSRIKTLEDSVACMQEEIHALTAASAEEPRQNVEPPADGVLFTQLPTATPYTKMTEQMISACYGYGKTAYQNPGTNIWNYADAVASATGMNRNSAFMYICAVKSLLEGNVFKRAINAKATRKYFDLIYAEFGADGLANALQSTRKHIDYRRSFNQPVDSIVEICDEYQRKI